jgi:SNF2 family DNA or RNA helicase
LKLKNAKYKIGATGTLLLNNPLDAYVPLAWIGAEKSTLTTFRYFYCEFSNQMTGQVTGVKNMDILKNQMAAVSLRRTKDLLNLPPKNIINEYVDMNEKHRKFYDDIKKGIKKEVDKVKLTTQSVLAMITRLRQATASPSILTTSDITSSKIERTVDLVEQIVSNGDKVVIFSTFKESAYKLKELLLEYNPVLLTGDTKESEVEIIKSRFQTDDSCKVFIGTWQKAGTGITLTAANYMIFIDTPWTYAEFEQSQDRIYRIGTKKSVFIYNLICKDTIDERVKDILYTKKAISDFVIDDKVSDATIDALKKYLLEEL